RGDLAVLSSIGVNFVHLYDWSVPPSPGHDPGDHQRNHIPFLQSCARHNIRVFVPVSNFFLGLHQSNDPHLPGFISAMVAEVYNGGKSPIPAAAMWGIGNEYDL